MEFTRAAQPLCGIQRIATHAHDAAAQSSRATPIKRPLARTVVFEPPQERERRLDAKIGVDTRDVYDNMRNRETWAYNPEAEYLKVRATRRAPRADGWS